MSFINDNTNQATPLLRSNVEKAVDTPRALTEMTIYQMFSTDLGRVLGCKNPTVTPENSLSKRAIQKLEKEQVPKPLRSAHYDIFADEFDITTIHKYTRRAKNEPYQSETQYCPIEFHQQDEIKTEKPTGIELTEEMSTAIRELFEEVGDKTTTTPKKPKNKFVTFLSSFSFKTFISDILDWFKKESTTPYDVKNEQQEKEIDLRHKLEDPYTVTITKSSRKAAELLEDDFNV